MAQRQQRASEINARRERRLKREAAEELAARAARENKAGRDVTPQRLIVVHDVCGLHLARLTARGADAALGRARRPGIARRPPTD